MLFLDTDTTVRTFKFMYTLTRVSWRMQLRSETFKQKSTMKIVCSVLGFMLWNLYESLASLICEPSGLFSQCNQSPKRLLYLLTVLETEIYIFINNKSSHLLPSYASCTCQMQQKYLVECCPWAMGTGLYRHDAGLYRCHSCPCNKKIV